MSATPTQREAYRLMFREYPDVVDIKQLCKMLGGIRTKTAYQLLQNNMIECFKIGRSYKIPKYSVIAFIRSGKISCV